MTTAVERAVRVDAFGVTLDGDLAVPARPRGVVAFAHGSGSSRHSPRNRMVAEARQRDGFATLLLDLLTVEGGRGRHADASPSVGRRSAGRSSPRRDLLIVGSRDETVLELNERAAQRLAGLSRLDVVPGATHLFEEPGALQQVAELARQWFVEDLAETERQAGR